MVRVHGRQYPAQGRLVVHAKGVGPEVPQSPEPVVAGHQAVCSAVRHHQQGLQQAVGLDGLPQGIRLVLRQGRVEVLRVLPDLVQEDLPQLGVRLGHAAGPHDPAQVKLAHGPHLPTAPGPSAGSPRRRRSGGCTQTAGTRSPCSPAPFRSCGSPADRRGS